jgi:putative peptidoglycan lipid II flippase
MRSALAQLLDSIGSLRSSPLIRDTVVTTGLSILGKGIGFAIPFFVAAWFGIGSDTDAFFFAYGLVLLLAGVFFPVVEAVIVPFITEIKSQNESEVKNFVGTTLVMSIAGLAALGALFFLITKPLLAAVSEFPQDSLDLISRLLLETSPLLLLLVGTSLLSGVLNAYRLFSLPAISPAVRAAVALTVIFALKDRVGVHSIALGYVLGELTRFIVLFIYATKKNMVPPIASIKLDSRVFEFLRIASYQVAGMAILAFNPVVDKTMASWLAPGSVSILEYSDRLYEIPITLITRGLFVVLLSHWSIYFYQGLKSGPGRNSGLKADSDLKRSSDFRRTVVNTARIVGFGAVVLSALLILLREQLAGLVYGHGEFDKESVTAVSTVWGIYLLGLGPTMFGRVFGRAHLVLKNTKVLMLSGMMNFVLNIALNLVLIRPLGLYGLALSTTITYSAVAMALMVTFLRGVSATPAEK